MKRLFLLIAVVSLLSLSANEMYAQRVVKKYNQTITVNPIGLAFGLFNVTYEQALTPENSFTAGIVYWGYGGWTAFGASASYRWYLFQDDEKMLKGLSFGPLVNLGMWSYENNTYSSSTSLGVGAELAYKWIIDGFTVEPIAQLNFNVLSIDGLQYRPFGIGINLGYSW
ncbi:MAG TPA: hypothetical protein PLE30_06685 [Candidatus Kapabacteria bacterium]|nr:hypothetical protein [Candidatus Kapabacteria bacterium]